MAGSTAATSAARITTASNQPPRAPARPPTSRPSSAAPATASAPMPSDTRAPWSARAKTSRPDRSAPASSSGGAPAGSASSRPLGEPLHADRLRPVLVGSVPRAGRSAAAGRKTARAARPRAPPAAASAARAGDRESASPARAARPPARRSPSGRWLPGSLPQAASCGAYCSRARRRRAAGGALARARGKRRGGVARRGRARSLRSCGGRPSARRGAEAPPLPITVSPSSTVAGSSPAPTLQRRSCRTGTRSAGRLARG